MLKSIGALLGALVVFAGVSIAQENRAGAPPVPQVQPQDELALAWIDTVKVAAEAANSDCQSLESVKKFNNLRQINQLKIETRLPGYTVDWSRFALVAKKPVVAPAVK
jgi:hypothetical protein